MRNALIIDFSNISNNLKLMKRMFKPSDKLVKAMRKLLEIDTSSHSKSSTKLVFRGQEITLPADFDTLLVDLARPIAQNSTLIVSSPKELMTTQQAADYLDISRPTLIQLLDRHSIPVEMVGKHRRIQAKHIVALRDNPKLMREALLRELAAEDQRLDSLGKNGPVKRART